MGGQILVAEENGNHLIKLCGDVRLTLSISFDRFIDEMFMHEFNSVTFDLREAEAVDSTTLGLMAKIALRAQKVGGKPCVVVDSDSIVRVLDVMGFRDILEIVNGSDLPSASEASPLPSILASEDEMKSKVIEAHKILIALNQTNAMNFRELVESLEHGT